MPIVKEISSGFSDAKLTNSPSNHKRKLPLALTKRSLLIPYLAILSIHTFKIDYICKFNNLDYSMDIYTLLPVS